MIVLGVAILFCFGVLLVEFNTSPVSFSISSGTVDSLTGSGLRGKTSLVTTFVMALIAALLPLFVAIPVFLFAVFLVAVVFFTVAGNSFDPSFVAVLATLLALFVAYLAGEYRSRASHQRKISRFFRRYVPSNLADYYTANPSDMNAVSDSRELTILFCDIKRFTSIAETLDPCLLYTSPSPRDGLLSRMPSSA